MLRARALFPVVLALAACGRPGDAPVTTTRVLSLAEVRARGLDKGREGATYVAPVELTRERQGESYAAGELALKAGEQVLEKLLQENDRDTLRPHLVGHAVPRDADLPDLTGGQDVYTVIEKRLGSLTGASTLFGMTYVFRYQTQVRHGGKGHYLTNITVVPEEITKDSLYNAYLTITPELPLNAATPQDPVARERVTVSFKVDPKLLGSPYLANDTFLIRGDKTVPEVVKGEFR